MFHFYNNSCLNSFNISSLFSGGIIISLAASCFTILLPFDLVTASTILSSKNSPALRTVFWKVLKNLVLYRIIVYKNLYHSPYFLVLGSIEYRRIAKLKERVISVYL